VTLFFVAFLDESSRKELSINGSTNSTKTEILPIFEEDGKRKINSQLNWTEAVETNNDSYITDSTIALSDNIIDCCTRPKRLKKNREDEESTICNNEKEPTPFKPSKSLEPVACHDGFHGDHKDQNTASDVPIDPSSKSANISNQTHDNKDEFSQELNDKELTEIDLLEKTPQNMTPQENPKPKPEEELQKTLQKKTPLEEFRRGYLWVSDLTQQSWCEQKMYYMFTQPGLVEKPEVMKEGTSLHLERGGYRSTYNAQLRKTSISPLFCSF